MNEYENVIIIKTDLSKEETSKVILKIENNSRKINNSKMTVINLFLHFTSITSFVSPLYYKRYLSDKKDDVKTSPCLKNT